MELAHHGIKGMRWGVRKDNKHDSVRVKSKNLEKFGTNGNNILFVMGVSGSGKSTLSTKLASKFNAEVIHLDSYMEPNGSRNSNGLNKLLDKRGISKDRMFIDGKLNYDVSDKILEVISDYSKKQKLIVEGVQLLDSTMSEKNYLNNKPVLSIQSKIRVSMNRAKERDSNTYDFIDKWKKMSISQITKENEIRMSIAEAYIDDILENL